MPPSAAVHLAAGRLQPALDRMTRRPGRVRQLVARGVEGQASQERDQAHGVEPRRRVDHPPVPLMLVGHLPTLSAIRPSGNRPRSRALNLASASLLNCAAAPA
jgi:hypothetical protein